MSQLPSHNENTDVSASNGHWRPLVPTPVSATTPPQASPAFKLSGLPRVFQAGAMITRRGSRELSPVNITVKVSPPQPFVKKLQGWFGVMKDGPRPYLFWSLSESPHPLPMHRACFFYFEKPSLIHWIGECSAVYSPPRQRDSKSLLGLPLNSALVASLFNTFGDPSRDGRWLALRLNGRWPAAVRRVPDSFTHVFIALG